MTFWRYVRVGFLRIKIRFLRGFGLDDTSACRALYVENYVLTRRQFEKSFENLIEEAKAESPDWNPIKWKLSHLLTYMSRVDGFREYGVDWSRLRYSQGFTAVEVATHNLIETEITAPSDRDRLLAAFEELSEAPDSEQAQRAMIKLRDIICQLDDPSEFERWVELSGLPPSPPDP
jgi:hypothetical protein